jgi:hypothetical protein
MAAMAGASGTRSWLQARRETWLTPKRMRAATATLFIAAFGISSVGLSGSTPVASSVADRAAPLVQGTSTLVAPQSARPRLR